MKKARISKKIIAAFMAFIIAFASTPIQAIALGIENMEQIEENIIDTGYEIDKDVFLVEEDVSKRGQFEKHYLCSDGTYVSVTYPEAIHYLDDNNKWQDVDQSLSYDSATGMYISDKADFNVSFSNKASADNIAQIERNGYTLSWGIQTTKKNGNMLSRSAAQANSIVTDDTNVILIPSSSEPAKIENPIDNKTTDIKERLVSSKETFDLPKISSQISYTNIFDETQNVSLEYTVYHNKIEEDIIISERGDLQSVSMNMDVGTLTPIVNDNGSVDLVDANYEMQFHIGIPYMVDAKHSVCNDIQVTAVKDGTSCIITYTPNAEWFESSERVFPILLDPSITTNDYVSNIQDTYVEENSTAIHSSEQYLYINPNGNNRRNAIVRITKLPTIDPSMPIVYATLSLTAQTAATNEVDLKAGYLDTALDLDDYDYYLTTSDYFSYTSYTTMYYGDTSVTFNVTSHIYEMYADKEFDDENGDAYCGDFVIGYDLGNNSTYSPPFYSSEYTTPSVRPVFTVKYGYTLPAGMMNGSVYSFVNIGSYCNMSVNGSSPNNNSNIYQVWNETGVATTSQKFKLEYVSGTGGYLLRSMSSSSGTDKVVTIHRAGNELSTNMNVRLSSPTDSMAQEWLIVPVDYDIFRIVPRANMSLSLTAYGDNDGTNAGRSATSQGNIFVKTLEEDNIYQEWLIYDNSNNELNTSQNRATIETGYYFIGNSYSGRYLHRGSGTTVNGMSGKFSTLGQGTVKWKIVNLGDGYCTIQKADSPCYYLAPASTTSGSNARIYASTSETIPENVKWSIRSASGGGCIIQHKTSGLYLTDVGGTANPSTVRIEALATPGTDAYKKQVWRVANEDYYVELGATTSFNNIAIDIGETKSASINKSPSNATWASYTDFDYTITSGSSYVTYNSTTHRFMGNQRGANTHIGPITVSVTATHKTTGLSDTFEIKVNKEAIIIIPGIIGSELFADQDYGYFKKGMPLISTSMTDYFHGLSTITEDFNAWKQANAEYLTDTSITLAEYADCLYDFLRCNNDGTSNKIVSVKKYKQSVSNSERSEYTDSCGMLDCYFDLYKKLKDNQNIDDKYYIEFFSYDWRMSNTTSANSLNSFISNNNYDKVTLIAHSMGGLVASAFLALGEEQQNKVDELYYIASPLLGSPEMANVLGNLDFSNLSGGAFTMLMSDIVNVLLSFATLTYDPIRNLLCNYQSIYELMPSEYYFSLANEFYMTKLSTLGIITNLNYSQSWSKLAVRYCYPYQTTLNNNSIAFHNSLYNSDGTHISENVNAFYLYGVGCTTLKTLESVETLNAATASYNYTLVKNTFTTDGDSMVPKWSATLNGTPDNNRIFRCSGTYNGHTTMLSNSYLLTFIDENIRGVYVYNSTDTNFTRGYN